MRWLWQFVVLLGFVHCGGAPSARSVEPSPSPPAEPEIEIEFSQTLAPLAYSGSGDIKVEVVPIVVLDGEPPQALLRVTGMGHVLDGVTFRAFRRVTPAKVVVWNVVLDGESYAVLATRQDRESPTRLQLPTIKYSIKVVVDDFLSKSIQRDAMLADHQKRLKDGFLAELERFHRDRAVKKQATVLKASLDKLNQTCDVQIKAVMDWPSVLDEDTRVTSFCVGTLAAVTRVCERNLASRQVVAAQIKAIECRRSEEHTLTLSAGGVLQSGITSDEAITRLLYKGEKVAYAELVEMLKLKKTVLRDASGLVVVLSPETDRKSQLYAGRDGKLYNQRLLNRWEDKLVLWNGGVPAVLERQKPGEWTLNCGSDLKEFTETDHAFGSAILANAKREPRIWQYERFALARDDHGTYYYVDRLTKKLGSKGFRVFKGPRGALKLTNLVDIVDDSNGMIFATTKGKLRLILKTNGRITEARWIKGKKERGLTHLSLATNKEFIYGDLGVYSDTPFGTICDL